MMPNSSFLNVTFYAKRQELRPVDGLVVRLLGYLLLYTDFLSLTVILIMPHASS